MTTKSELLALALEALTDSTDAGRNVWGRRDQPTSDDDCPCLFVTIPLDEDGESFGRNGAPAFTVTSSLSVEARALARGEDDDAGAVAVYEQLARLRDQIKRAVINYGPLMRELQQFAFFRVREKTDVPSDAAFHVGAIVVEIGMEYVQSADEFCPVPSSPLEGMDATVAMPSGTPAPEFSIDLPQTIS